MKCPKCHYLGFETGDRCKNCGYDFSLLAPTEPAADLPLREQDAVVPLPLFQGDDPDEPLIKLPAAPRPPLAVRRTPDRPRRRPVAKPVRRYAEPTGSAPIAEPALQLFDEPYRSSHDSEMTPPVPPQPGGAARRLAAAAIDHAILLGVDAIVIYFTLKMAALAPGEWQMLPPLPLAGFLGMLKAAYFCAFTLVGGQTIGKMAARIRVVREDGAGLDPGQAVQRTIAGAVSMLAAGLGFLPVFLADDQRGIHDRVARTRVVAVP